MKCSFELSKATTLIVAAEKIMYGIVYVRLSYKEDGVAVSYVAIADGGEICGENTTVYNGKNLSRILRHILDSEYPEEEDYRSSYRWGIQIGDSDNNLLAEIERANWGEKGMDSILSCLEDEIGESEALDALRDLIEF